MDAARSTWARMTRELGDERWRHPVSLGQHADYLTGRAFLELGRTDPDDERARSHFARAAEFLQASGCDDAETLIASIPPVVGD